MIDRSVANTGLRRLTVHQWFLLMLAAITVVVMIFGVVGAVMLERTTHLTGDLVDRISPARIEAAELQGSLLDQETGVRGFLLTGNRQLLEPYESGVADERRLYERIEELVGDQPKLLAHLHEIRQAAAGWRRDYAEPLMAERQADQPITTTQMEVGQPEFDRIRVLLGTLNDSLAQTRQEARDSLVAAQRLRDWMFIAMVVMFLVAGLAMAVLLRRAVVRPLDELRMASREVAEGNFGHPIPAHGPSDIREVALDVDEMRSKILAALEVSRDHEATLGQQAADLDAQAVELRRSNAELEQFAYVASHDLQEPLRKIATFCQLLEKRYVDVLDDRGRQYIHFAVDGATRMQGLINDLLSYSRVGRLYDARRPVNLRLKLDKALDNLAAGLDESGATVEAPEDLPQITGDPMLLTMLWQNLIGNAVKFRHPDRPPVIRIGCEQEEEGEWRFCVTDNGIGVSAEFADKIFVIFQRLHNREAYGGTGIGLAMCKKIVENHGGRIWLDTTYEGEGTRICFTLRSDTLSSEARFAAATASSEGPRV
ncbi:CHASE3 domain-containing protein [Nonomuraea sp. MCN248]|uniref:histidine kinase n=1 Tax=Nonomuraea corallina TaxID=2989783 RepID=A0ABT4SK20_9ACTN|nr:CHASE3 domain-containing protein [Nonomuraea corallina]MDA0637368.1 CHASE3 domain-containing protein [Nonomuraea corallina]